MNEVTITLDRPSVNKKFIIDSPLNHESVSTLVDEEGVGQVILLYINGHSTRIMVHLRFGRINILSAIVGVTAFQLFSGQPWLAASIAVSTSIALMHLTKTLHPPGGATALIAVIGSEGTHNLGYLYVLIPVALGAGVMLLIALIVNNIPRNRRYPEFWI